MDTYSAVVTTGIYCRPGCAARPRPDHVRPFASAAAAEAAGYRACLRCRPYRTSDPVRGAEPELVCRAVQLIADGALDGAGEEELGARLGVSARHLRRLFATHVGATPDRVARSRRVHFARRLLDDTDLTVTEIAFASGHGSVRQLNRACHEVFRASPAALRARRRRGDRLVADGGLVLRLPVDGPFDPSAALAFLAARAVPGVEQVRDGAYRRTITVDGDPGVVEVEPGDDEVRLRLHLPHWEGLIHLVARARRLLGLDLAVADAVRDLEDDPVLGPSVRAKPGLRVPGGWDGFELGVRAIVGQQISVAAATTILGRLVERHGPRVPGLAPMELSRCFPTAAAVAEGDLTGLGLPGARAEALREFARGVAAGELPLDRSVGLAELEAALTSRPGIGPWTAGYLAMRLGERDAMPVGDLGLRRGLAALAPGAVLAELAPTWSPWRAVAAMHLWHAAAGASSPELSRCPRSTPGSSG